MLGVETVRIVPGATEVTPLVFEHYPVSHSLLADAGWAFLLALVYWLIRKDGRGAIVVALLVASHWILDFIVHAPDLPIVPGSAAVAGLGLWDSRLATLAVEVPIFLGGLWLYLRAAASAGKRGNAGVLIFSIVLLLIYAANIFGAPPPDIRALAWVCQAQWLLVAWGYWIDRRRMSPTLPAAMLDTHAR
jgi:hypothetical protein